VLYDDRIESPGVKFNDADLIGLPIRLVVSARNIDQGVIEVKKRSDSDAVKISTDEVVKYVTNLL
jgi:prolyl-tRNA synthetase